MTDVVRDGSRSCDWCHGPLPVGARRDAITCSKRCRQARHRFHRDIGQPTASTRGVVRGHPRRLAYADPPYPGKSKRYYGDHRDFAGEVDHAELIASLTADYDAWALSTSASALRWVLELCPSGARVASWMRGHRVHATARMPINAWEPVIYWGQIRRPAPAPRDVSRSPAGTTHVAEDMLDVSRQPGERVDALVFAARPRLSDDDRRVTGAKPAVFCRWIFDLLDARPEDSFTDIYPGSGGVSRAWAVYSSSCTTATAPA